jgi:hypothetical protein
MSVLNGTAKSLQRKPQDLPAIPGYAEARENVRNILGAGVGVFSFHEMSEQLAGKSGNRGLSVSGAELMDVAFKGSEGIRDLGATIAAREPALKYTALKNLREKGYFQPGLEADYVDHLLKSDEAMDAFNRAADPASPDSRMSQTVNVFFGGMPSAREAGVPQRPEARMEGGLPTITSTEEMKNAGLSVNLMVNGMAGAFIMAEHSRDLSERAKGSRPGRDPLLTQGEFLDAMLDPAETLQMGARFTGGDPALTYAILNTMQESGYFKHRPPEEARYVGKALPFLQKQVEAAGLPLNDESLRGVSSFVRPLAEKLMEEERKPEYAAAVARRPGQNAPKFGMS